MSEVEHIVTYYVPWWVVWSCAPAPAPASVRPNTDIECSTISNQTALNDEVLPCIKSMRKNVLRQCSTVQYSIAVWSGLLLPGLKAGNNNNHFQQHEQQLESSPGSRLKEMF